MEMKMNAPFDQTIFPKSTTINENGHLTLAGFDLVDLAEDYGTPLYLYDGATIRYQVESIKQLFARYYPGESLLAYASKAYFSQEFAKKIRELKIGLDLVSLGEMNIVKKTGFSPADVHLHGNNKSAAELEAALDWDIQAIVVDNNDELSLLEALAEKKGVIAKIWLRITPDLAVNTHPHIETGSASSKFGFHLQNGQAAEGIRYAMNSKWLKLTGLHSHLGSQLLDPAPYQLALKLLYQLAESEGYIPEEISPGGGWGVRYQPEDLCDDPEPWVRAVSETIQIECERLKWPLPRLVLEPGRFVVAKAGVALYRVGTQKETPSGEHIIAVDGGMADNPRVALYQAKYTASVVQHPLETCSIESKIVGKYCESGDVLIEKVNLPRVERGDILAIPVSGAYQITMSSNYNFTPRPTVLWVEEGKVEKLQSSERLDVSPYWGERKVIN
jgi:diaminopimelate decarboxylase